MQVYDLIKNQDTYRADAEQSVLDVALAMVERNIGAVPVLRDGLLVGVFSERDLMKRVVVEGRDAAATRIADVMTANPFTVEPDQDVCSCMALMQHHGFRHLPIMGPHGKLLGVFSVRDALPREVGAAVSMAEFNEQVNDARG